MLNEQHVKQMLEDMDDAVLSLYLNVNNARPENQAAPPAWRIELKNALKQAELQAGDEWKAIENRIEDYFTGFMPSGRTLALFVSGEHLHEHVLPLPIDSQSAFGEPLVTPLLWAMDEYEPYLIVQVDSERARFIRAYLGTANQQDQMQLQIDDYDFGEKTMMPRNSAAADGGAVQGRNRDQYEDMIAAHVQRFNKDVVARLGELYAAFDRPRVILSGDERAANTLQDMLPEKIKQNLVGVVPAPLNLNEQKVLDTLLDAALAYERAQEKALVEQVIGFAKAGGRGVLGYEAVLEALGMQQVETLIVPWPLENNALYAELPLKALNVGSQIELVHGEPAAMLLEEGGIGARLYYALETEN